MSWADLSTNYNYEDIFIITANEVYEFVKQYGWNFFYPEDPKNSEYPGLLKLVVIVPELPEPYDETEAIWLFLPLEEKGYPLVTFGSYDRAPWKIWYYKTEKYRDIGLIQKLLDETKESFDY